MKKIIAIGAIALVMTSCSSSASAVETKASAVAVVRVVEPVSFLTKVKHKQLDFKKEIKLRGITNKMESVVNQVKSRVGKTWYVFSGASPRGWDCSGLTYWAYEQLGIEIPHSANKQGHLNKGVKDPKVGDIVLFGYKGTRTYYHAALYIGNGKIIHAGFRKGTSTQILDLNDPSLKGSKVKFVRLVETL
jgi:cell wall-associated NlpC family hydrolase